MSDNHSVLRDNSLVPLSRQHHHALALCVRIERAAASGRLDMLTWQAEIQHIFVQEIQIHFDAEESVLFPAALRFPELGTLVEDLIGEHALLRDCFALAKQRTLDPARLHDFARKLSAHIRKEERQLFEQLQRLMSRDELIKLAADLGKALASAQPACSLANEATRLPSRI